MKQGVIMLKDIKDMPAEWIRRSRNGNDYIKVALEEHAPDKYGNTHALRVILPQGIDRKNQRTYICNFREYVADDHNEDYR